MKSFDFSRHLLCICVAAATLAGCGGSQPPLGAPGAMQHSPALATHAERGKSWMLPEAKANNLLYVADEGVGIIVYSYGPSRLRYVGLLGEPQFAEGECVDRAQNIFITDDSVNGSGGIFEYAHGGTSPIAILGDPDALPMNCSGDLTTGNLAVVGYPYHGVSNGVAIYKKARGRPTFYASAFAVYDCGYDDKGNLFIDGGVISGRLDFAELPKGSTTFRKITLNQSFRAAGGIQWDGKHLAVGDFYEAMIYQFDISGKRGTEVGSTPLTGSGEVWQFFIDGDRVIAPSNFNDEYSGFVNVYDYPAGGAAKRTRYNADNPYGVAVSLGLR
jgi:hypothetical protein